MNLNEFFSNVNKHRSENLPFVIFSKPKSSNVSALLVESSYEYNYNLNSSGFVFSPFCEKYNKTIFFPLSSCNKICSIISKEDILLKKNYNTENLKNKTSYINKINKAKSTINSSILEKVVISRKEKLKISDFNLEKVFVKLKSSNPNAFCYIWFHPLYNTWLGASPEKLISINNNKFETIALAGTIDSFKNEEIKWTKKEIDEHNYVKEYIVSKIKPFVSNIIISKTESVKSLNLFHLKTKIKGSLLSFKQLKNLINLIHPTPAVCGFPHKESFKLISEIEGYNRRYYSGFLGEINLESKSASLFVNLRCAELIKDLLNIYVGAGITNESIPTLEWDESDSKTMVIKNTFN